MITLTVRSQWNQRELERKTKKGSFTSLNHAAAAVRLTARRSIRRRQKPAPAGGAPHTRTGALKRAIRYQADRRKDSAVIGPSHSVVGRSATAHEFGGRYRRERFPQRPFMEPALIKNRPRLAKHWRGSIR